MFPVFVTVSFPLPSRSTRLLFSLLSISPSFIPGHHPFLPDSWSYLSHPSKRYHSGLFKKIKTFSSFSLSLRNGPYLVCWDRAFVYLFRLTPCHSFSHPLPTLSATQNYCVLPCCLISSLLHVISLPRILLFSTFS